MRAGEGYHETHPPVRLSIFKDLPTGNFFTFPQSCSVHVADSLARLYASVSVLTHLSSCLSPRRRKRGDVLQTLLPRCEDIRCPPAGRTPPQCCHSGPPSGPGTWQRLRCYWPAFCPGLSATRPTSSPCFGRRGLLLPVTGSGWHSGLHDPLDH